MYLTLVRHGEASLPAQKYGTDEKRPLTSQGHQQAEQTAHFISENLMPDVFIVSPLLRAQETLVHIQRFFPDVPTLVCNKIKPDDEADVAVEWLSQLPYENIVVVCHMNVVAHIEHELTLSGFNGFSLAEARIYQQNVIANGLSTLQKTFIPKI